jgi:hypothetical protein
MTIPAHIEARTAAAVTWWCHNCGARFIPGAHPDDPDLDTQILTAWLQRHQHDSTAPPTRGEPQ